MKKPEELAKEKLAHEHSHAHEHGHATLHVKDIEVSVGNQVEEE